MKAITISYRKVSRSPFQRVTKMMMQKASNSGEPVPVCKRQAYHMEARKRLLIG
jgi:hypothetical protein